MTMKTPPPPSGQWGIRSHRDHLPSSYPFPANGCLRHPTKWESPTQGLAPLVLTLDFILGLGWGQCPNCPVSNPIPSPTKGCPTSLTHACLCWHTDPSIHTYRISHTSSKALSVPQCPKSTRQIVVVDYNISIDTDFLAEATIAQSYFSLTYSR